MDISSCKVENYCLLNEWKSAILDKLLVIQDNKCKFCSLPIHRPKSFSKKKRKVHIIKDGWFAVHSDGKTVSIYRQATLEHVRPLHLDGKHHPENVVAACYSCNQERASLMKERIQEIVEALRISK